MYKERDIMGSSKCNLQNCLSIIAQELRFEDYSVEKPLSSM